MSKWAIAMTIFPTKWWANGRDGSVLGWQPDFGWFLSYYLEDQLLLISINWKTPKTSLPKGLKTHGTFLPPFQVVGFPTTNKKTRGSLPKRQLLLDMSNSFQQPQGRPSLTDANVWVKHAVKQPSTICVCISDESPNSHACGGHENWIFAAQSVFPRKTNMSPKKGHFQRKVVDMSLLEGVKCSQPVPFYTPFN